MLDDQGLLPAIFNDISGDEWISLDLVSRDKKSAKVHFFHSPEDVLREAGVTDFEEGLLPDLG